MGNARERCSAKTVRGVLVEEMVHNGTETIVGITHDPVLGPVRLLVGLGGVFTEVLQGAALGKGSRDQIADRATREKQMK